MSPPPLPGGSTGPAMLDLDATPRLRRLFWIARYRVTVGFIVAAVALWLATPSWRSLGIGALIAIGGEGLRVWAAGHLRKGREITRSGPYRFVRHPLYIGSFVIGVGFVVAAADLMVAVLVLGYLAVTLQASIRLEEATLRSAFGEAFERFDQPARGVPRRRFTLSQMIENGEHRSLLGFTAAIAVLGVKAWL